MVTNRFPGKKKNKFMHCNKVPNKLFIYFCQLCLAVKIIIIYNPALHIIIVVMRNFKELTFV
jgi:hypothetical protein